MFPELGPLFVLFAVKAICDSLHYLLAVLIGYGRVIVLVHGTLDLLHAHSTYTTRTHARTNTTIDILPLNKLYVC